jgi:hypothetical protein
MSTTTSEGKGHWVIVNPNDYIWGGREETYSSAEAATAELRQFFKGCKVDFSKFTIEPLAEYDARPRPSWHSGACT